MLQSMRGQLWKGFLNIGKKRIPGAYDKLVSKALGKRFHGKVDPRFTGVYSHVRLDLERTPPCI